MPPITLDEIRRSYLPTGAQAIGGGSLDREITWTAVLRARPPAFPRIGSGELALISMETLSFLRLVDPTIALPQLLESLAGRGVAGVVVVGQPPPDVAALADRLGLPVIVTPASANVHEIDEEITRSITERRTETYQRTSEIQRSFTEAALGGGGLQAILDTAATLLGKPVAFEDAGQQLRLVSPIGGLEPPSLAGLLERTRTALRPVEDGLTSPTEPPVRLIADTEGELGRLVAPVVGAEGIGGYLSALGPLRAFQDEDRMVVARAAAACVLELSKEQAVVEAETRLLGDYVGDLLEGRFLSEEMILTRAPYFDFEPDKPYRVIVFHLDPYTPVGRVGHPEPASRGERLGLMRELTRTLAEEAARRKSRILFRAREESLAVLYPADRLTERRSAREAVEDLRRYLGARRPGMRLTAGLGRYYSGLEGLRTAYQEADQAVRIAQSLLGGDRTADFAEMGVYRLLLPLQGNLELRSFHDEYLGALRAYDQKNKTELVRTLEAFFACRGNLQETAQYLHLHRNSLAYRVRSIEKISRRDLDDFEDRLLLHLALKIHQIL